MRRQFLVLMFSALVGVCALSVAASPTVEAGAIAATPVTAQRVAPISAGLRDEAAAMVLVGTALIGLAAVVRRAA